MPNGKNQLIKKQKKAQLSHTETNVHTPISQKDDNDSNGYDKPEKAQTFSLSVCLDLRLVKPKTTPGEQKSTEL